MEFSWFHVVNASDGQHAAHHCGKRHSLPFSLFLYSPLSLSSLTPFSSLFSLPSLLLAALSPPASVAMWQE